MRSRLDAPPCWHLHLSCCCLPARLTDRPSHPSQSQTMGKPFLSRHFLSEQASCLASVPFAAAGAADEDGVSTTHNLLALGTWSEDTQVWHQSTERHRRLAIAGGST